MKSQFKVALAMLVLFVVQGCTAPDSSTKRNAPGPVLTVHYESAPLIPVTIAGEQYQFLLDTGASITFIDRRLASRFKALTLSELPRAYQADFATVNSVSSQLGSEQLGFVEPQPFSVGSVTIDDSELWATIDFDLFSQSLGSRIDGILGIDTIRRFNWVFDRDRHQLTASLTAPSAATFERCIGYEDSYNRSPAVYLTHGESSVRMYLDTGADQSYADHAFIDFMASQKAISGEDAMPRKGVDASGMVEGREHILTGLHFDERQLGELRVSENSNEQYGLGLDFVNRFNRFAIMPGRMMLCYDADSLARKVPPILRNIGVRFDGEHLQVYYSDERDLAPYGLANGDILEQINGVAYRPLEIDKVRELLSTSKPGSLKLRIVREGKPRNIAI
ncbi:retroviral-like aspartic protease family protein [Aeromonas veronii]|uniref:retropepsin-like aspartic protease n=1 Tax=Aeromonas veronii TaxID=654 RepID=UPI001F3934B4|nr:aspartyl protease family protein [Aeromonas veronii]MCF5881050.1 retroviral-like aspartic protease family protein [Aeromonas veronii]